jgi:hypothetical protein
MIIIVLIVALSFPVVSVAAELGADSESTDTATYVDRAHHFRVVLPPDFEIGRRSSSELRDFTPAPVAGIFFMNPQMAGGQLAGVEPADLEIRIYSADSQESLETWLAEHEFAFGDTGTRVTPYRQGAVNGLEVCQSTLLAPGCSIYVRGGVFVYQLTPATREGEQILSTFTVLPAS